MTGTTMFSWLSKALQGPSFGQTRPSPLQELLHRTESCRQKKEIPLSRRAEQQFFKEIFKKRDATRP